MVVSVVGFCGVEILKTKSVCPGVIWDILHSGFQGFWFRFTCVELFFVLFESASSLRTGQKQPSCCLWLM